jgi:hypothetical protein
MPRRGAAVLGGNAPPDEIGLTDDPDQSLRLVLDR